MEDRREKMMQEIPEIDKIWNTNLYFDWGWKYCGFGQLSVSHNPETDEIVIENECMSRDMIRKIMHAYVDHIVDHAKLADEQFMTKKED